MRASSPSRFRPGGGEYDGVVLPVVELRTRVSTLPRSGSIFNRE